MDRFRSMPMSRTAVLIGRTLSEIFRNVGVACVTVGVGVLVGFRFHNGLLPALAGLLLLLLFGYAVSWFAAYLGLSVRNAEAAQAVGGVWIFPFTLISSAFVPTDTMPGWLQAYAAQPHDGGRERPAHCSPGARRLAASCQTVAWSVGLIAVFAPLAVRKYGSR